MLPQASELRDARESLERVLPMHLRGSMALSVPRSSTLSLQSCETTYFSCVSHLVGAASYNYSSKLIQQFTMTLAHPGLLGYPHS